MNLSDTSSIVTLLLGAVTVCAWLWNLISWFRKRHIEAKELADEGARLAQLLLSNATSPAKRSDIHFFMTMRAVESASRQTKATVYSMAMGIFNFVIFMSFTLLSRFFDIDYTHPLVILMLLTSICLVVSFSMMLLFSYNLRRLEDSWQVSTMRAIEQKVDKHMLAEA